MQKTIFITGASSGLGKTTAIYFQQQGWNVIATMRHPEKETVLNELPNVTLLPLDVTNEQQIAECVDKALQLSPIDVVLNNAGYGLIGSLEALESSQIRDQIETNLFGVINVSRAFIPYFRQKRSGVIINITSTFGILSYPTCSVYSATKFGIDGFSEAMAYELAQFGVKVKVVAPGGMQTDFAGRSLQTGSHEAYRQLIDKVSEGYSAEQIANYTRPSEVAEIIFEAATDDKNQLRYIAGKDAIALTNERIESGAEGQFRMIREKFIF